MSNRDTLNRKRCKTCNKWFVVGANVELLESYCSDCEVKGWLADMKNKGCSVSDPSNVGRLPYIRPKKLTECPQIEIRGVRYRDITCLISEDDKVVKTYPTREEWKKINRYRERQGKADAERRRQLAIENEERLKARKQAELLGGKGAKYIDEYIIRAREEGFTYPQIARTLGITKEGVRQIASRLRRDGRIKPKKNGYTAYEERKIMDMEKAGVPVSEIAKATGRTELAIRVRMSVIRNRREI